METFGFQQNKEKLIDETLDMLRNKPVNSTPAERWFLLEEAVERYAELPQPLKMGHVISYMVEHSTLLVRDYDLLLGRFFEKVPTDEEEARLQKIWDREEREGAMMLPNDGHMTLDWPHVLEYGISGYIEKAAERLEQLHREGAASERIIFMEGLLLLYRSCRRYMERYAEAAALAGREDLADMAAALCRRPPETFHEALQMELFVLYWYYIYGGGPWVNVSCGRMDDRLLPYYEADIQKGRLTREDAGCLVTDFYCRTNMILGRGEHQFGDKESDGNTTGWYRNHLYDTPTYVVLGGYSNRHDHRTNPLTELFVECIVPRFENPVIIFRWTKDIRHQIWSTVCDRLRHNASIIIYNDERQIPSFEHQGVEHADAVDYTMHACNWPDIPAGFYIADYVGGPIPKMIMNALYEDGKLSGEFPTLDSLYDKIGEDFRRSVREHFAAYRDRYRSGRVLLPQTLSVTDCFTDGVLQKAQSISTGAVKYPIIYALIRNIGTAADMMAALDKLVYQEKTCSLVRMCQALEKDFRGFEDLYIQCINSPKFGTDNDAADSHAVRLMTMLLDILDEEAVNSQGARDVITLNVTITDMWHIREGADLMATPDGRREGAPLSENLSPTAGVNESVTALLNSVAKLPFDRIQSGAFNIRLSKNLVSGEEGLKRMLVLSDVFFEKGGMQLQYSVADTEELRAAQRDPEKYRDLMVRITGYSAVFVDMCLKAQEEIIRRDEMN